MSSSTELQVAEMLAADKTYREIAKELHVGPETIKTVRDYMAQGIIQVGEDGKAVLVKPAEKEIETIHTEVMEVITKKATELALQGAEEDYALGNEIRQYWNLKAEAKGMEIRDYVRAALIFYDDYEPQVKEMEEKLEVADLVFQQLRADIVRQEKLRLYYEFVRYCLYLKSRGMRITPEVTDSFWQDLTLLEKSEVKMVGGGERVA